MSPDHDGGAAARRFDALDCSDGQPIWTALELVAVGHRVVHGGPDLYRPTRRRRRVDRRAARSWRRWRRCTTRPLSWASKWPGGCCPTCRTSRCSTPRSSTTCPPRPRPMPSTASWPTSGTSAATGFTARRTSTSASRRPSSSDAPLESLNQIVLHLGNGASASAIVGGRPVDTSMGLTPMEGLVMGTRSGDVDPGVIVYLWRTAGMSVEDIESMLNRRSGMSGLGGEIDFRVLHQRIESGDDGSTIGLRRLHPPAAQVHRRLPGGARATPTSSRSPPGSARTTRAVRRDALDRAGGAGHRTRRAPQRQPGRAARAGSRADKSPTTVLVIPTERGTGDRAGVRAGTRGLTAAVDG